MTAAMVDSHDFLNARRRLKAETLVPQGTLVAFTGGQDYQDVDRIWSLLDNVHAKHPDMVLLHGASPKGAELIAAKWADTRKVKQVAFRPDWKKPRRQPERCRADRSQMGRHPQGQTGRVPARLEEARQGRPVPAQRRHAGSDAGRHHPLPRRRNQRQPRRQGPHQGHPGSAGCPGRRLGAGFSIVGARRKSSHSLETLLSVLLPANPNGMRDCSARRTGEIARSVNGIVRGPPMF